MRYLVSIENTEGKMDVLGWMDEAPAQALADTLERHIHRKGEWGRVWLTAQVANCYRMVQLISSLES